MRLVLHALALTRIDPASNCVQIRKRIGIPVDTQAFIVEYLDHALATAAVEELAAQIDAFPQLPVVLGETGSGSCSGVRRD